MSKRPKKPGIVLDYTQNPPGNCYDAFLDDLAEICKRHKVGWWFINQPLVPCPPIEIKRLASVTLKSDGTFKIKTETEEVKDHGNEAPRT